MAQITSVTSELLQAKIRDLLPSQQGFGEDLQASNVIMPVIDLTAAAEGTTTPVSMQQALAFGSQTFIKVNNQTTVLINTPGFYRFVGTSSLTVTNATVENVISMSDGLSTKNVWFHTIATTGSNNSCVSLNVDLVFFTGSGDSVSLTAPSVGFFAGSVRQIADVNGNLVNPSGFSPQ